MTALSSTALSLVERGWPVFPLGARKKTPIVPTGVKAATTDPARVADFWVKFPAANIGLACGPDSVEVLDVDGPEGEATLAALVAEHGPVPETMEVQTGRGRQLYFEPAGVKNSAGKLGPGLDTRGAGGYVVAVNSIHPSGAVYTLVRDTKPAPWPAWLLELLTVAAPPPAVPPPPAATKATDGSTAYGRGALRSAAARVAAAPEGTRNETLNREAHAVAQLVTGGEVVETDARAVLEEAAREAGLPDAEARRTLDSAFRAGERSPRSAPPRPPAPAALELVLDHEPTEITPPDDGALDEADEASFVEHHDDGNVSGPAAGRDSAAAVLVEIGVTNSHLFHDDRDAPFAAIGPEDARRIVPIRSGSFTQFLAGLYYRSRAKAANGEALSAARNVLAFKARFEGPRHVLHNRFALHEDALWIDLADDRQRAVRVTADGWTVTTPPILFRRFGAQAPLPEPNPDGDLTKLFDFVNVRFDHDRLLLLAWIATAVLGYIPRPILTLHGPQGAAKTTAAKMARKLTDPSAAASNRLSAHDDELALTLESNAVPLFDNVTSIPARASELLCQAVTGGGFSKRELFSDSDEVVYSFRRAMILTGINVPTAAPDLLDRLLLIQLDRVGRGDRKPDAAIWRAFDAAAPDLFGGLLNILSGAMRVHAETEAQVTTLERLADFTLWGASVAEALGYGRDAFLDAYSANVARQTEEVLEADPVARAVRDLVAERGTWTGTASELLKLFRERHPEDAKGKDSGWPARADGLSRRLRILHSTLAEVGISARWDRRSSADRTRTVTLEPVDRRRLASGASGASGEAQTGLPGLDAKPDANVDGVHPGVRRNPAPRADFGRLDAPDASLRHLTGDEEAL